MIAGMLNPGDELFRESDSGSCRIDAMIGAGTQGEVYRATLNGSAVAVKWYYVHTATAEQRAVLRTIISAGSPDARFVWPQDLLYSKVRPEFGYVMPLFGSNFRKMADLQARRVTPPFKVLVTISLHLADGFRQLHAKGLCYRDISPNNTVFDPATGDILICDNDNVAFDNHPGAIDGTPKYMAPEIVIGTARPSTQTDLYSLSVLLFMILINNHPLEGKREAKIHALDLPAMNQLCGSDPLFIFDPHNQSNAPLAGYHDNALEFWPLYPHFLQGLFIEAFTMGLRDADKRIRESTWRAALSKLRDLIFYCKCGAQNFADVDFDISTGLRPTPTLCWRCRQPLVWPPRIFLDNRCVMLSYDAELYSHHIDPSQRRIELKNPVGKVVRHPTNPDVWGLRNCTSESWSSIGPAGETGEAGPGKSVTLANGTIINFGSAKGKIVS